MLGTFEVLRYLGQGSDPPQPASVTLGRSLFLLMPSGQICTMVRVGCIWSPFSPAILQACGSVSKETVVLHPVSGRVDRIVSANSHMPKP